MAAQKERASVLEFTAQSRQDGPLGAPIRHGASPGRHQIRSAPEHEDQADADSDGLGDVCDDTFTNSTVVTEIISAGNAAVEFITNVNPPGGNGLIAKLTGNDGVATKVDAAVSAYEAGTIDEQTYLLELQSALEKLDAFDNQLAGKIRNGQIADPEATELTGLSALIRQAINDLIANASS